MTAVEYLETELKKSKYFYKLIEELGYQSSVVASNVFEQAKEMERVQIINAYDEGSLSDMQYPDPKTVIQNGEQYYTQTYKSTT